MVGLHFPFSIFTSIWFLPVADFWNMGCCCSNGGTFGNISPNPNDNTQVIHDNILYIILVNPPLTVEPILFGCSLDLLMLACFVN